MKKWKMPQFCLLIFLCLMLNYGGRILAEAIAAPCWLDSVGTVLSAYLLGPVFGIMVGVTGNLIEALRMPIVAVYGLTSIVVALIVGIAGRRGRLKTLLGTLTVSIEVTLFAVAISAPLNLFLGNGSTGNIWGDAAAAYLQGLGLSSWLSVVVGQLYVELLDKVIVMVAMFFIARMIRMLRKWLQEEKQLAEQEKAEKAEKAAKEEAEKAENAGKVVAGALIAALLLCGAPSVRSEGLSEGKTNYNDYVKTVYASTNGLPCGEANDIAQTNDGILWVGTYAGLYRYNGKDFRWMDGFDTVRNVNCLYVDEEGRLWIGTNDNGLSIVINEHIVNVLDQTKGLPSNSVRSILKCSDGYYYIGTTGSMQILSLASGLKIMHTLREVIYAHDSAADDNGHVAAVTNDGKLFLMQGGQILSSRQLVNGEAVYKSCCFDLQGRLMAGTTGNKIYIYDISDDSLREAGVIECGELKSLKNITTMESGEIFVTADNGVGYFSATGEFDIINTNTFNNSIDNMLVDYQGNLWFTSSRLGLLRMAASDFRNVYGTAGMENQVVNCTTFWQGCYYFGTDRGLDAVDSKCRDQVTNALTERFQGIRIRCILTDSRNHLWVCTYGSGLVEIEPDGTEHLYNQENGSFGNRARVVTELSDGTILAAGDTGISYIRDQEILRTIQYQDGLINSMILTLTELPNGVILAGTDGNGIALLEDGQITRILTRDNGLSSEVILRTVLDPKNGGVYVVTSNGLCYMNTDYSIRPLNNFPYFNNYDIWVKDTETLFVMSSAGIYIVDRTELLSGKDDIAYELLDGRRGLNSSLTANSWTYLDDDGDLFLASDTGVYVINTKQFTTSAQSYRMNVTSLRIDGAYSRIDRYDPIILSRGAAKLELFPEIVNYSIQEPYVGYYMEGFDAEWTIQPQSALGTIVYTNLPTGNYVFHLAVFDNNQEKILAERTYELIKERDLQDSPGFIVYMLIVPMLTVGWITWLSVKRREERMQRELELANREVEMGRQTIVAIARAVDAKDIRTAAHSERVAKYSRMIAESIGLPKEDCEAIERAGQMHDIGKIAIPDRILNKDSRLTDEEYATMKTHTTRGAEILKDFTLLDHVVEGAQYHHERYDGRGYPAGLKGEEIPLYARIIGVADAFDAMTANRVYRKQMDFGYVLNELEKGKGKQFDPQFVDVLLRLIREGDIDLNALYGVNQPGNEEEQRAAKEAEKKQAEAGEQQPAKPETTKQAEAEDQKQAKPAEAGEQQPAKPAESGDQKQAKPEAEEGKQA